MDKQEKILRKCNAFMNIDVCLSHAQCNLCNLLLYNTQTYNIYKLKMSDIYSFFCYSCRGHSRIKDSLSVLVKNGVIKCFTIINGVLEYSFCDDILKSLALISSGHFYKINIGLAASLKTRDAYIIYSVFCQYSGVIHKIVFHIHNIKRYFKCHMLFNHKKGEERLIRKLKKAVAEVRRKTPYKAKLEISKLQHKCELKFCLFHEQEAPKIKIIEIQNVAKL